MKDGNIGIRETNFHIVCIKFVLKQKDESILLYIKNIFDVGNVNKTSDIEVFRYNLGSFKSNSVTVNYFLAYPLKGKKTKKNMLSLSGNLFEICY